MTLKNFSISLSLVSLMVLTMFSCGSDEDKIVEKPKSDIDFPKEDLVGAWTVISINDEAPLTFINTYETPINTDETNEMDLGDGVVFINNNSEPDGSDEEDIYKIDIDSFYFDFAADDLWTLNVKFEMTLDLPDSEGEQMAAPGQGESTDGGFNVQMLSGKVEVTGTWSGTYSIIEGPVLSLITKERDVKIMSVSKGLFEKALSKKKVVVQNELLKKFKKHVLTHFAKAFITLEGKTLNLETTGSARTKMVLEKQ